MSALPDTGEVPWSVGLMTGTVLDGNVDIALLRTDGEQVFEFGPATLAPYPDHLNALLKETLALAQEWRFEGPEPAVFAEAERTLSEVQAQAVQSLLDEHSISNEQIGIVGFHGQTVLHRGASSTQAGRTRQLGDGQLMADQLGIPVAFDFRSADVAAGGQGAPLAPLYHCALLRRLPDATDTAVLNLGGVANITWWDGENEFVAFDTGPANAPLNDFVDSLGLGTMDRDGLLAASGTVDEQRLQSMLQHSYFSKSYPKSLDRFDFTAAPADGLAAADGAALLTAFTAAAVGIGLDQLPARPTRLIICGGGRLNPTLMQEIKQRANVNVLSSEEVQWRGDMVEAECFAFLAMRTARGLPISYPGTTGVAAPLTGGQLAFPQPARSHSIEPWLHR